MGQLGGLVDEQVLHHDQFHAAQRGHHVHRVGVALGDVFALYEDALEVAVDGVVEHVGDAQARLGLDGVAPQRLEHRAGGVVADVAVAGQFVRERPHVAAALHVVLAAQRVHAHTVAAEVAGGHGEVGHAHHHRAALAVLGDAEAVVDGGVRGGGVQAGGGTHLGGGHAGVQLHRLGAVLGAADELGPVGEVGGFAALADEAFVDEAFGDDDVRHRVDDGDVGAGAQLQEVIGLHVRGAHQVDAARVDHDELRAVAQAALHPRCEHRVGVGGVGADEQDEVGMLDRLEVLRAGRGAERLRETEAGG